MMITAIGQSEAIGSRFRDKKRTVEPVSADIDADRDDGRAPKAPSTALVPRDPERSRRRAGDNVWFHRPSAPFIAQLIATRADMPQTRARRRAEPAEAAAVYGDAAARTGYRDPGRRLRMSL